MAEPVPLSVRQFVVERIASVGILDVLLLLRATPEKTWTTKELGRATVTSEAIAQDHLEQLARHALVRADGDGYVYAPGDDADVVDELADAYARRRHTVIGIIYGADNRQATTLSNAFRVRKRKKDG